MSNRDLLKSAFIATPECLSPEQLVVLADSTEQSHPHVKQCVRCQTELALLKTFQSDVPIPDEGAAVAWISSQTERRLQRGQDTATRRQTAGDVWTLFRNHVFGRGKAGLLIPAGAVLVLAITSLVVLWPAKEPDVIANLGNQTVAYRSQEIEVIGPFGELQQAPTKLQWQAYQQADSYRVEVMEVDRTPLWTSNSRETEINFPSSIGGVMHANKPILWQVTAIDAEGNPLATSQVQRFSVSTK